MILFSYKFAKNYFRVRVGATGNSREKKKMNLSRIMAEQRSRNTMERMAKMLAPNQEQRGAWIRSRTGTSFSAMLWH